MAFKMKGSPMHSGTASHKSALKQKQREISKEKGDLFLRGKTKDKDGNIVDIKWAPNPNPTPGKKDFLKKEDFKKKSPTKQTWPGEGVEPRPQTKKDKKADKKLIKKANKIFSPKKIEKDQKKQEKLKLKQSKKRIKDFDKKSKDPNYTWGEKPAPTKQRVGPDGQITEEPTIRVKKKDGVKKKRMMKKELKPIEISPKQKEVDEEPKKKRMMKKELKTLKKPKAKHWNEKLTKLTNKRKKLKTKQDKREEEGKGTKIIDFRVKRNQKRINKEYKKVGN